jgi:hypothetical protein
MERTVRRALWHHDIVSQSVLSVTLNLLAEMLEKCPALWAPGQLQYPLQGYQAVRLGVIRFC